MTAIDDVPTRPRRAGIQSIEIGGDVLEAMLTLGAPANLSDIAKASGLQAAKVHRYLASFCEIGLTQQFADTGRYGLGPLALRIGLSAISQHDIIERAYEALVSLCDDLKTSGHLSVWSEAGPVVIRSAHGGPPVISPVAVGTLLPLQRSASGLIYLSYMSPAATVEAQAKQAGDSVFSKAEQSAHREKIKAHGYALAEGQYIPGLCAIALPILNHDTSLAGAVTLVSTDQSMFTKDSKATVRVVGTMNQLHRIWS